MFTGIISHLATITSRNNDVFTFKTSQAFLRKVNEGNSIAINGVCLTVTEKPTRTSFSANVMPETQRRTTFAKLKIGDMVNLELPATPETFLSGHIVQGHIDGVGEIRKVKEEKASKLLTILLPKNLLRYIVSKGSITINGISLTVIDSNDASFVVGITPYTWKHTTLKNARVDDKVNIETDIIGKYVHKYIYG